MKVRADKEQKDLCYDFFLESSRLDEHCVRRDLAHRRRRIAGLHRAVERFEHSRDVFFPRRWRSTTGERHCQGQHSHGSQGTASHRGGVYHSVLLSWSDSVAVCGRVSSMIRPS